MIQSELYSLHSSFSALPTTNNIKNLTAAVDENVAVFDNQLHHNNHHHHHHHLPAKHESNSTHLDFLNLATSPCTTTTTTSSSGTTASYASGNHNAMPPIPTLPLPSPFTLPTSHFTAPDQNNSPSSLFDVIDDAIAPIKNSYQTRPSDERGMLVWCDVCDVCGKRFFKQGSLIRHIRAAHRAGRKRGRDAPERLECPRCPKTFSQQGSLNRHLRSIHESRKLHCRYCSLAFGQAFDLKRHQRRKHPHSAPVIPREALPIMKLGRR